MKKTKVSDWFGFFAPRFCAVTLGAGVLVRIILLLMPITQVHFGFFQFIRLFLLGAVNDLAFTAIALIPAFVLYSLSAEVKYRKPFCWILEAALAALTFYVVCFNDITDEYGSVVPTIANALLCLILICYSLKLFIPSIRDGWRRASQYIIMVGYAMFVVFINVIGEPVFWEEFGVRYNFIAVDYLVYTNEVIGNIVESYPMVPVVLGVLAGAGLICFLMVRRHDLSEARVGSIGSWAKSLLILTVWTGCGALWLHWGYRHLQTDDTFLTELQENGCWDFLEAYSSSELDYEQFYAMMPEQEVRAITAPLFKAQETSVDQLEKNIVLITIESLSADFLATYGNTEGITPNLDRILSQSLSFDNLFATGNRTVRGLEAVTLCLPPSSGESIVKRPDNGDLFSTGKILREKGYSTTYIYGGDAYFDNMKAFFGSNGYDVFDKEHYDKDAMQFYNIWGTCDEDSYREALAMFDRKSAAGEKFFAHLMTISNHRPYTYPEGRIEYDGNPMSRQAAVKYTDWALGDFLEKASTKDWFDDTVFVIIADHCASSAGKTSLPLEGYHIPAMIYAPGFIEPQRVEKVCSQIDVMPTLFNLLGISYDHSFYGQDVLSEDFRERAFMATYQDLGYYADGILTVLSPVKRIQQFRVDQHDGWNYTETPMEDLDKALSTEAQAMYQSSNLSY